MKAPVLLLMFGFSISSSFRGSRAQMGIGNGVGEIRVEQRDERIFNRGD